MITMGSLELFLALVTAFMAGIVAGFVFWSAVARGRRRRGGEWRRFRHARLEIPRR